MVGHTPSLRTQHEVGVFFQICLGTPNIRITKRCLFLKCRFHLFIYTHIRRLYQERYTRNCLPHGEGN